MKTIPIFFASNDKYVPYLDVAILSIIKNASPENNYEITILKTDISDENQTKLLRHNKENVTIKFYDVKNILEPIKKILPDMFHYTLAAYYRLFIETAFPQYEKAIYLDCDLVLLTDIAELYNQDIGDNLVAAVYEQNTHRGANFTEYVKNILGIPPHTYFNSGVMLMNLKEFRKNKVQDQFIHMLTTYNFDCLAPDQEYLNVICHKKVKYLPTGWNKHSFPEPPEGELKLCHFALSNKPWHYKDTVNGEYFWNYAKESVFYQDILNEFNNYSDEDKKRDFDMFQSLLVSIEKIKSSEKTFKKLWFDKQKEELDKKKSSERLEVLKKINEYEKAGRFNDDVEDDAPAKTIRSKDVDYTIKKLSSKILTGTANFLGKTFFESMIKNKKFIIKDIKGLEYVSSIKGGAIVTCNHFNLRDNYAVYRAMRPALKKHQRLYKVIKESNYTNFKGPVRLMMRHGNTLPLSSSTETMKCFYKGITELLNRGEKILIYPEQSMWWNYRKPRPLKIGAYKIAVANNVPILPVFITMTDSSILDDDGFFVQEYHINFLPPIYPDSNLTPKENAQAMSEQNYNLWVKTYEDFYKEKLTFNN